MITCTNVKYVIKDFNLKANNKNKCGYIKRKGIGFASNPNVVSTLKESPNLMRISFNTTRYRKNVNTVHTPTLTHVTYKRTCENIVMFYLLNVANVAKFSNGSTSMLDILIQVNIWDPITKHTVLLHICFFCVTECCTYMRKSYCSIYL